MRTLLKVSPISTSTSDLEKIAHIPRPQLLSTSTRPITHRSSMLSFLRVALQALSRQYVPRYQIRRQAKAQYYIVAATTEGSHCFQSTQQHRYYIRTGCWDIRGWFWKMLWKLLHDIWHAVLSVYSRGVCGCFNCTSSDKERGKTGHGTCWQKLIHKVAVAHDGKLNHDINGSLGRDVSVCRELIASEFDVSDILESVW